MSRRTFGDAVNAAGAANDTASYPPDGQYTATVTTGNVSKTKAGDAYRLGLRFVVDSGPEVGKGVWNSQMLRPDDEMNVKIFSRMCKALGVDPAEDLGHLPCDTAEDIAALLEVVREKAIGQRVQIRVRTKGDRAPEAAFVDPLAKDAPPSQLDQAKKGVAQVAAAAARKPAGPAGPARPAL